MMAGAECDWIRARLVRNVSHHRLRAFAKQQTTHCQLFLREVGYLDPHVRAACFVALVISGCNPHLVKSGIQPRRISKHDVVLETLGRFETRRGGHDSFEETRFDSAFVVEYQTTDIKNSLNLPVRLFPKEKKLAGQLDRSVDDGSLTGHVVVVSTYQYKQCSVRIRRGERLTQFGRSALWTSWLLLLPLRDGCWLRIGIEVTFANSDRVFRMSDQLHLDI